MAIGGWGIVGYQGQRQQVPFAQRHQLDSHSAARRDMHGGSSRACVWQGCRAQPGCLSGT
jgi:hypothetical protein